MDAVEKRIIELIDRHSEKITAYAKDIERHPEPGFQELRTAARTAEFLEGLGIETEKGLALTGVRGSVSGDEPGFHVTILGEMDAIFCKSHPLADQKTGVAHACGHHAQLGAMMGAAAALSDEKVRKALKGKLSFFAVPAEEYLGGTRRREVREQGVGFPASGKSELIRTGAFEDTDIMMTTHVHMIPCREPLYLGNTACNGFTAEHVVIRGRAAHGAINPWDGVNALSIATSAIGMMGLMRESFREEDHVRLHNIIQKAGDAINTVPEEAVTETKVRAASLETIQEIRRMTERAYDGAAYAFGGKIEREVLQGYMPVRFRPADRALCEAAEALGVPFRCAAESDFNNACTDVGDLTHIFPVLNFTFGGTTGSLHGADFRVTDDEAAYIVPAKVLALTAYRLLKEGGSAREVVESFTPVFTRESYIRYIQEHYHI